MTLTRNVREHISGHLYH